MGRVRALVVGGDTEGVTKLTDVVIALLGPGCEVAAIELDTSSVDSQLAWGTAGPRVRPITPLTCDRGALGEQPLAEDGDTWKAIVDAAHRTEADVIVVLRRHQHWLSRVFSGSAARDLIEHSELPVLVVEPATLGAGPMSRGRTRPVTGPSIQADTMPGEHGGDDDRA
jgi:hypothetical protein